MKLIDLLAEEVRASAAYNSNVQAAPSVILWTDKLRQWESALPLLQAAMPELVVLGDYAPQLKKVQLSGSNALWSERYLRLSCRAIELRLCISPALSAVICVPLRIARRRLSPWLNCSIEAVGGSTTTLDGIGW